jgi:hypothetical protein
LRQGRQRLPNGVASGSWQAGVCAVSLLPHFQAGVYLRAERTALDCGPAPVLPIQVFQRAPKTARVKRLEELGAGLMKEVQLWERMLWSGMATPVPTTELHQYLGAVRRAIHAIAEARSALSGACRRPDIQ